MVLSSKLLALGIICYLFGFFVFSSESEAPTAKTRSTRQVADRESHRRNPLQNSGAHQIESTLAFVEQLDSPESCRSFAAQLNTDPKNRHSKSLWSIILARWSQLDPEGMITFLAEEKGSGRPTHMESLAWQAWGASDPQAAFTQVDQLNIELSKELFKGIAQVDPDLAIELAFQAPDADKLVATVLKNGKGFSSETSAYLAQFLNLGWIGFEARELILRQTQTGDPATDRAIEQGIPKTRLSPSDEFLVQLSREQPEEAIALLESDPSSRSRAISTVEIAKNWALKDRYASLAWIREQSSPQIKNSALVAIASVIGGQDPLLGLSLIEEIEWAETKNLRNLKYVSEGGVERGGENYQHLNQTLPVATSLLQALAINHPDAALRYLEEKVPARHRESLETALKN